MRGRTGNWNGAWLRGGVAQVRACVADWQPGVVLPDFVSGQRAGVAVGRVPVVANGRPRARRHRRLVRGPVRLVRPQTDVVLDAGVVLVLVRHLTLPISSSVQDQANSSTPHSMDRLVSFGTWVSQGAAGHR